MPDIDEVNKALTANGTSIRGASQPLKVQPIRRQMTVAKIFTFLKCKVDEREKLPLNQREGRSRSPNRDPHFVRKADAEGQKTEQQQKGKIERVSRKRSVPPGGFKGKSSRGKHKPPSARGLMVLQTGVTTRLPPHLLLSLL